MTVHSVGVVAQSGVDSTLLGLVPVVILLLMALYLLDSVEWF